MAGKWRYTLRQVLNLRKSIPLVLKLLKDPRVARVNKILLVVGSAAYFILPVDIIPDFLLPGLGYVDDMAVIIFLMNRFINSVPAEIVAEYMRK